MFNEDRSCSHSLPATTTRIPDSQKERWAKQPYHIGNFSKAKSPGASLEPALLKIRPIMLTIFFIILLKSQRKLTLAVISDSFTVEKMSKALGLGRYGCDSHMTLDKSLFLF